MTLFEILLSVLAVGLSGGAIAYTLHAVRSNAFVRPTEAEIKHMIDTAPPGESDNESTRKSASPQVAGPGSWKPPNTL